MADDGFAQWHRDNYGWGLDDADYVKFKGEYQARRRAWQASMVVERKLCALVAQSFQVAHCKSHYDDAVDSTAERIKEAIMDRGSEV